jgi:hypothetical protein
VTQSQETATKILTTLKVGTVRTLRSTSQILERTANRLETQNSEQLNPVVAKVVSWLTIAWQRFLPIWNKGIGLIRDRLPADLNAKIGDRALNGIVAGSIVVLFWFTSSLFSSKPPQPAQVAVRPPVTTSTQPTQFPADLSAPEATPEVVSSPIAVTAPEPIVEVPVEEPVEPIAEVPEPIIDTPIAETPEESIVKEPIVEAPPKVELTAEQKQIAEIWSQVTDVSDQFITGLVVAVEPNLDRSQLKVQVSEDWYRFSPDQQDRFANELWARSQSLDLNTLRITDAQDSLVARPPIVGDSMIILKRKPAIA